MIPSSWNDFGASSLEPLAVGVGSGVELSSAEELSWTRCGDRCVSIAVCPWYEGDNSCTMPLSFLFLCADILGPLLVSLESLAQAVVITSCNLRDSPVVPAGVRLRLRLIFALLLSIRFLTQQCHIGNADWLNSSLH